MRIWWRGRWGLLPLKLLCATWGQVRHDQVLLRGHGLDPALLLGPTGTSVASGVFVLALEVDGGGSCPFPFDSSLFLSFDRAPPARPFDVLGLPFARLGIDGSADPGDSGAAVVVAAAIIVEDVVAEETGRDAVEARGVGLGSGEGIGRVLSGSSSYAFFFFEVASFESHRERHWEGDDICIPCKKGQG